MKSKKSSFTEIVVDGKASAVIVLAEKPTRSAQFAALELQYHIEKMTSVKLPVCQGDSPSPCTKIYVGLPSSGPFKNVEDFEFQEYAVIAEQDGILLAGCDEPDYGKVDYRKSTTFPDPWKRIGTAYAVYDFLEILGCRWFLPTDLGITCIPGKDLRIRAMSRRRKPTMEMRDMYVLNIPSDLCGDTMRSAASKRFLNKRESRLWYLRRRHGGKPVIINHSLYRYYDRFLEQHKDWFAKGYSTTKPAQLCYSNPEVCRQVVQDARDFFDGKMKNTKTMVSNFPEHFVSDVFPVFPMDNRSFCRCPQCNKYTCHHEITRGKDQFSNDYSSEYLFRFVNEVAKKVKESHPDKLIGAGAYAGFAYPPKGIRLEENVMVMLCLHTRLIYNEKITGNDDEILKAWCDEYPEMKKYVWMYWCFPFLDGQIQQFRIFPGFFAEKVGKIFRKYRKAGVEGLFHEPAYMADPFQYSPLFDQVESYINWSLAWDESRDENELFREFFHLYYGPAEEPMKQWYRFAESIFTTPAEHKHQTDRIAWEQLGSSANMEKLGLWMKEALSLAVVEPYRSRVRLFEKGVWQYMMKGKKQCQEEEALKGPSMQKCIVPRVKDVSPDRKRIDWSQAAVLRLYGGLRAEKLPADRNLRVQLMHDGTFFYIRFTECDVDIAQKRKEKDLEVYNEWEIHVGAARALPYHYIGFGVMGNYNGLNMEGIVVESWDVAGEIWTESDNNSWSICWRAPLETMIDGGVRPGGSFYGNIIKSSRGQAVGVWVPTFGGFHTPARFGEFVLAEQENS